MLRKVFEFSHIRRCSNIASTLRHFSSTGEQKPPQYPNHIEVPIIDVDSPIKLPLPEYPKKPNEPLEQQKQRLIYQSRKRGMLENDLLLSTFAAKYLPSMSKEETDMYDDLINGISNDWDLYYWATNTKPTPPEYDNEIMRKFKKHVANENKESRTRQPDLEIKNV